MLWGSFDKVHLTTLVVAVILNIILYFILKNKSRTKQIITLFVISLFGAGVIVFTIFNNKDDILRNLPLDFWALNAILLPLAVLFRGKKLCNILLIWSFSSILALTFNGDMASVKLLSWDFVIYYAMHTLCAGIPVILFELNLARRDTDTVKFTISATAFAFLAVHIVNIVINSSNGWSVSEGVNYMCTLAPENALLSLFFALIPLPLWYMILAIPLLLLYLVYWYLPEILDERRRKRPIRKKIRDIDKFYEEYEEEYIEEIIDEKYDY